MSTYGIWRVKDISVQLIHTYEYVNKTPTQNVNARIIPYRKNNKVHLPQLGYFK